MNVENSLMVVLAVLCGVCVIVKVLALHARHRQLTGLSVSLREYQTAQRELKAALHEENRVRARDHGLARTESRLLKQLGLAK